MRLIWSPLAVERLKEIYSFIYNEDPAAAKVIVNRILQNIDKLTEYPMSGRIIPELNESAYREIIVLRYRVMYRVTNTVIEILTIRHERQSENMLKKKNDEV